eukprot:gene11456-biopygen4860
MARARRGMSVNCGFGWRGCGAGAAGMFCVPWLAFAETTSTPHFGIASSATAWTPHFEFSYGPYTCTLTSEVTGQRSAWRGRGADWQSIVAWGGAGGRGRGEGMSCFPCLASAASTGQFLFHTHCTFLRTSRSGGTRRRRGHGAGEARIVSQLWLGVARAGRGHDMFPLAGSRSPQPHRPCTSASPPPRARSRSPCTSGGTPQRSGHGAGEARIVSQRIVAWGGAGAVRVCT